MHGSHGSLSQPATAHRGSPTMGNQDSNKAGGPSFSNHPNNLWSLGPKSFSCALLAPKPINQFSMPPRVLPIVATKTAGQNMSGFNLMYPNKTGSEPSGKRVADIKEIEKTAGKPTVGRESQTKKLCKLVSMFDHFRLLA